MAYRNSHHLMRRGLGLYTSRQIASTTPTTLHNIFVPTHNAISIPTTNTHDYRFYSSTVVTNRKQYKPNPLDAFRDPVDRETRGKETVGRQWSVKELRRKSYEDLHRLWYVLYKEKNVLLTEQQLSRRRQLIFPQPERFKKVQKSMGAIRQVLGERKRVTVAAHLARQKESELESAA